MNRARCEPDPERVLVLAPHGRDATLAVQLLHEGQLAATACQDLAGLVAELRLGAGAAIVTEDAVRNADLRELAAWIAAQPAWSDFPFLLLTNRGGGPESNPGAERLTETLGNISFVERPFHPTTLMSVTRTALRGRRRQYEARARLQEVHDAEERLRVAQQAGGIGSFELFPSSGRIATSEQFCRLWGVPIQPEFDVADLIALIHPEDRPGIVTGHKKLPPRALDYVEYRIVRPDTGEVRWIARRGEPLTDERIGSPRYAGVCYDITDRKQGEEALRASGERFRAAVAAVEGILWTNSAEGEMVGEQPGWAGLTGQSFEEYQGYGWAKAVHPDDVPPTVAAWTEAVANRRMFVFEHRVRRKDGAWRRFSIRAVPALASDGSVREWVGVHTDITDQRANEDALREETRALEILNRAGTAVASDLDLERVVQTVTDAGVELTGAEFGAFFYNVLNEDGASYMLYSLSGVPREAFAKFPMPRATKVFEPTFKGEGIVRSDDIVKDERYGHSPPYRGLPPGHLPVRSYLAVPVKSRSGEVIGGLFFGHSAPGVFGERSERVMSGLAGEAAIAIDNARLFQAVQRELAERRRAEEALQALNQNLEQQVAERTRERDRIWRNSQDLLIVVGADGVFQAVNPAVTPLLGYRPEELIGRRFDRFVHPDDIERTAEAVARAAAGVLDPFENRYRRKDGSDRWFSWTAAPQEGIIYGIGRDITAEKEQAEALRATEEALRQAQKMEAVGQLTGGIAHDFNNLLTGIVGSLDLMQTRIAQGRTENIGRYAKAAMSSAGRAAALTHRLLAFSRRQPLDPKPVDANKLVASMEDLIRRTIGEGIEMELVTAGGLWLTLCDSNQLESAILNLAINARDAMPDGGKLTLETANAHLDDAYAAAERDVTPGQYVAICLTDTGTGMPPDVIARAFEPFFTTKPIGHGTGLGLSMVYGFAKQSEGHVRIYSEMGRGTTIKIYLPRFRGAVEEETSALLAEVPRAEAGETVLVVEDEPVVRNLVVEVLQELGYRVIEAQDGPSALKLLLSKRRVDLLVTDVGLPGLNGRQLADQARERRPSLQVLFMTGYAANAALASGFLEPGMEMITKPFAVEALATKVRAMFETAP